MASLARSSSLLLALSLSLGIAWGAYDIPWWSVDGGGGTAQGGSYTLNGTIGQPDAGAVMTGGSYALQGGFQAGAGVLYRCQPDAQIKLSSEGSYAGDGIYNMPAEQTKARTVAGVAAIYHIRLQNDGEGPDRIKVQGPGSGGGWTISYFNALSGGLQITAQVVAGTWTTATLGVGETADIRVEVKPASTVITGQVKTVQVSTTSYSDPAQTDAVVTNTTKAANLTAINLVTSLASPRSINTRILLTGNATGGGTVEFKFRVGYVVNGAWNWTVLRGYGTYPSSAWTPAVARTYSLQVWAREVGSTAGYQMTKTLSYVITPVLSALTLTANPPSPSPANTPIALAASKTGGANVQYQYRVGYQVNGAWTWTIFRVYGPSPTCTWTPTIARQYTIQVWAREVGYLGVYQVTASLNYSVTAP